MEKIDYKALAAKLFCFAVFSLLGILFFKYLFSYSVPFFVAWGIAYLIFPLAKKINKKTKISRKFCSFVLVLLILGILMLLTFLVINRLIYEMQNFVDYLSENSNKIAAFFEKTFNTINTLGEKLPIFIKLQDSEFGKNFSENINMLIENVWQSLIERLGSAIPDIAAKIVVALPNVFLVTLITLIACFYFAVDIDSVNLKIKQLLPPSVKHYASKFKQRIFSGLKKYLKAYCILFVITFFELLIAFLILGVDYAFVLAILIAFVDFLPVLGTGAVLVPWGIVALLMKNYFLGIGIIVLFVVMTVVRQIVEPKIVGKSLGVHPILTLITLYLGYKLFGVFGMIFLPIIALIIFSKDDSESSSS